MAKVFLGGPCYDSGWRNEVIPRLQIDYYSPVVVDVETYSCEQELEEMEKCDLILYTITPKMQGVYSIAEVVDDSNKRPEKTILYILEEDGGKSFNKVQIKSLDAIGKMVVKNGGKWARSLDELIEYLNGYNKPPHEVL